MTPGRREGVVHAIVGRVVCRCPRAHVAQDKRAARVHVFGPRFAGTMRLTDRTEIGSCAPPVFQAGTSRAQIQIQASHHRAFHAGAVLGVVNALRCASTRPTAGPSGIDDASARHDLGYCAMAGFLMAREGREKRVDAGFPQAHVDVSRPCRRAHPSASHPVHAERVSSRRPQGTVQAHPSTRSRQAATLSRCA